MNIPAGVETNGATGNYYDMGGPFADCVNLKKGNLWKRNQENPTGTVLPMYGDRIHRDSFNGYRS